MRAFVDATTLISLGTIGELDVLSAMTAEPAVLPATLEEVTTEPARTAVQRAIERELLVEVSTPDPGARRQAATVLGDQEETADVALLAGIIAALDRDDPVALVSDDRRLRNTARGLGATVTGTLGMVVRAVEEELDPDEAKGVVRRLDQHGLHMTARLRTRANERIDEAAE